MPNVSYEPDVLTLENFPHGDTLSLPFDFLDDETGDPIDLTIGYSAAMRFEKKDGTEVETLTSGGKITLGNGFFDITVETATWPNNCTVYSDFQAITPGGNTETWFKVIVQFKRTITNPI